MSMVGTDLGSKDTKQEKKLYLVPILLEFIACMDKNKIVQLVKWH